MFKALLAKISVLAASWGHVLDSYLGRIAGPERADLISPLVRNVIKAAAVDGQSLSSYDAREVLITRLSKRLDMGQLPMWLRSYEAQQVELIGSYSVRGSYEDSVHGTAMRYFQPHETLSLTGRKALRGASKRVVARLSEWGFPLCQRFAPLDEAAATFGRSNYGTPVWCRKEELYETVLGLSKDLAEVISKDPIEGASWDRYIVRHQDRKALHEALPAVVGMRGQPKGNYVEAGFRAVFQYPRVIMNLEKSWFIPLFERMRRSECMAAWIGSNKVAAVVSEMFSEESWPIWSIDYSKFDSSIPCWLINAAFDILRYLSTLNPDEHRVSEFLQQHFTSCDLLTPLGRLTGRNRGIPSGSALTNMIGSVVNLLVMEMTAARFGFAIAKCLVQGDDGVFQIIPHGSQRFDLEAATRYIKDTFGMTLHPDKQLISTSEVRFLQNVHRRTYRVNGFSVGVRPFMRILNGMMSYEKFKPGWTGAADSLRWIQQVEAARYHPSFPALVEFLSDYDEGSTKSVASLIESAGGLEKAQGLLSSGFHMGKTPVEMLDRTKTAEMLVAIRQGRDPWLLHSIS